MTDITFKNHDPDVMLELWHVTKRFGGLTAVGDVSFKIKKGEIYALIGPNGAGKTTIFNLITGVYALTEGRIIFNGTVIGQGEDIIKDDMRETEVKPFQKKPYDIMSRGMARTFQNIRLFKSETVYNNVLTACHAGADYNIFQSLWRFKVGPKWLTKYYWQEKALREKTEELLKIMGIWEQRDMIAVNLPYGQQRKLEIARALATNPKLLLLDEPAAASSPSISACARSASFTIGPLPRFKNIADFFIFSNAALSIRPSVSSVSGACTDTISDVASRVSKSTLS